MSHKICNNYIKKSLRKFARPLALRYGSGMIVVLMVVARGTRKEVQVFERFDFTDDGQYFRVLVVKIGRVRIASYSNRLGLSVWQVPAKK